MTALWYCRYWNHHWSIWQSRMVYMSHKVMHDHSRVWCRHLSSSLSLSYWETDPQWWVCLQKIFLPSRWYWQVWWDYTSSYQMRIPPLIICQKISLLHHHRPSLLYHQMLVAEVLQAVVQLADLHWRSMYQDRVITQEKVLYYYLSSSSKKHQQKDISDWFYISWHYPSHKRYMHLYRSITSPQDMHQYHTSIVTQGLSEWHMTVSVMH